MEAFAEEQNLMPRPRRSLIGSFFRREDPIGYSTHQMVPGSWAESHSNLSSGRVYSISMLQAVW